MDTKNDIISDLRPALQELLAGGMRQAEIAREIGLSRATVNFAVRKTNGGWMPGYDTGKRLLALLDERRRASSANVNE